jgi:hypothetical protein
MFRRISFISSLCLALGSVNAYADTYATCVRALDFTTAGSCGTSGQDILLFGSDQHPTRAGNIASFIRINPGGGKDAAPGYNTDDRALTPVPNILGSSDNCGGSCRGGDESSIPEPATLLVLGTGLALVARQVRRKPR